MADTYAILGFSPSTHVRGLIDSSSPVTLYESGSYGDCVRWVDKYTRWGDWGGYVALGLYEIAPYEGVDRIHLTDSPIEVWSLDDSPESA